MIWIQGCNVKNLEESILSVHLYCNPDIGSRTLCIIMLDFELENEGYSNRKTAIHV